MSDSISITNAKIIPSGSIQNATIIGKLVPAFAASAWTTTVKRVPKPGASYLIRTAMVGPVYDVAYYNGRRPDGAHWWTLGNVDIDPRAITHWATITDPDEDQS